MNAPVADGSGSYPLCRFQGRTEAFIPRHRSCRASQLKSDR